MLRALLHATSRLSRIPVASVQSSAAHTTMSTQSAPLTVSSLTYLSHNDVRSLLLSETEKPKVAIIDVRDNDYIGGHIAGCTHVPINQLDARLPELLRQNKDKDKVVFHCMLSQQRGPRAALMYARAKTREEEKENDGAEMEEGEGDATGKKQEICVLEGGFGQWQARYGTDKRLTEGYVKDIWDNEVGF